jgi:hypothetical protein
MTARAAALRALHVAKISPERRASVVVVFSYAGEARVWDRGAYAREIKARDHVASFLVESERVEPGEVLVLRHSRKLGATVERVRVDEQKKDSA